MPRTPKLGSGTRFRKLRRRIQTRLIGQKIPPHVRRRLVSEGLIRKDTETYTTENVEARKSSAEAIAASIGRKTYGKQKFQKMAQKGKS